MKNINKTITLSAFIEMLKINKPEEGRALWGLLANRNVFIDGVYVESGTFRYNAGIIADFCGGAYLDYYCSSGTNQEIDKIMEKFMDLNVSTTEM